MEVRGLRNRGGGQQANENCDHQSAVSAAPELSPSAYQVGHILHETQAQLGTEGALSQKSVHQVAITAPFVALSGFAIDEGDLLRARVVAGCGDTLTQRSQPR